MIDEKDINGKMLYEKIKDLLNNSDEYKEMINNLNNHEIFSSSEKIYKEIKEIVNDVK